MCLPSALLIRVHHGMRILLKRGMDILAQKLGMDPAELAGALKRAIAVVKSGQPALVDVVTDPR